MASEVLNILSGVLVAGLVFHASCKVARRFTTIGVERRAVAGPHPMGPIFRVSSNGGTLEPVPLSSEFIDTPRYSSRAVPSLGSVIVTQRCACETESHRERV